MSDFTVRDVAAEFSVNPETVKRMLQAGRLEGYKVGSRWRVTRDAIAQYKLGTTNNANTAARQTSSEVAQAER